MTVLRGFLLGATGGCLIGLSVAVVQTDMKVDRLSAEVSDLRGAVSRLEQREARTEVQTLRNAGGLIGLRSRLSR